MTRRWSLARRMTLSFTLTTVGLVAAISIVSASFIRRSVGQELDSLATEELDEVRAIFIGRDLTEEAFAEVTLELADLHPGLRMGWRLAGPPGSPIVDFGALDLLEEHVPTTVVAGTTITPARGIRWRVEEFSGWQVGLALDGTQRLDILERYGRAALVLVGVTALFAVCGGALFARRVARMLAGVADSAQAAAQSGELVRAPDGAPEEVAQVVQSFAQTLDAIRAEGERAQLLIAGLAHELRSPIQNMLSATDVALMRERDAGEYRTVLESHVDELQDLGRVVDNLVTLCARSERTPIRESFDLAEEIELRLNREQNLSARRGATLEVEAQGDLRFEGDREALVLVIRNLVGNAISFSPPGGTIRLALSGAPGEVRVTVDDAGPGVPPEERERIFEPFHRGPTREGRRAGYGLGLALARRAVEAHGGLIEVGQSPHGGARFHVRLPRSLPRGAPDVMR